MPSMMGHDMGWDGMAQDTGWRMGGQDGRPYIAGYILTAWPVFPVWMAGKVTHKVCLKLQIPARILHGFA